MIYLASTSPRRRKILKSIKRAYKIVKSTYKEKPIRNRPPSKIVMCHALGKADNAICSATSGIILGVDTIVYNKRKVLGKPRDMNDAVRMLRSLSGKSHYVYSGIALINLSNGKRVVTWEKSKVIFYKLNSEQIKKYLKRISPLDKAGAYAVQDSKGIVKNVVGSYQNVIGLPVERLTKALKELKG